MTTIQDVQIIHAKAHANGYQTIAVRTASKIPAQANWPYFEGIPGVTEATLNVGFPTARLPAVDVDVDNPEANRAICAIIEGTLGPTITRGRENSPRKLFVYRTANQALRKTTIELPALGRTVNGKSWQKVEFLCTGQQFVGFTMHESGVPYTWTNGDPTTVPYDDLPEVSEGQIEVLKAALLETFPSSSEEQGHRQGQDTRADIGDDVDDEGEDDVEEDDVEEEEDLAERARAALKALPNDYDRDTWIKIGMAAREGGVAFEDFDAWSKKHESYNAQHTRQAWDSFNDIREITVGTLFHEANKRIAGWDAGDPLPLFPSPDEARPYPVEALGPLADAVRAISDAVNCDPVLAAQSVIAAANLAVTGIADVELPHGRVVPISLYLITIAYSGERKTTADNYAVQGVYLRSKELRDEQALTEHKAKSALMAHRAQAQSIKTTKKLTLEERRRLLEELGPEPRLPPAAVFLSTDLTAEGLLKHWPKLQPNFALFTSEGGVITDGAAMNDELKTRTAGTFNSIWDGVDLLKLRAGSDELLGAVGKRLTMHLMIQPALVGNFLGDEHLRSQGLLSRISVAWPRTRIGFRPFQDTAAWATEAINRFKGRILQLLRTPLNVKRHNELEPRTISLKPGSPARKLWINFHDEVEAKMRTGEIYEDVKDVGSKSAEQAIRIAATLTLVENPSAVHLKDEAMENGIALARWYLDEAHRLQEGQMFSGALADAARILDWLNEHPEHRSLLGLMRFGPNRLRTKAKIEPILNILNDHGWLRWRDKGRGRRFRVRSSSGEWT